MIVNLIQEFLFYYSKFITRGLLYDSKYINKTLFYLPKSML